MRERGPHCTGITADIDRSKGDQMAIAVKRTRDVVKRLLCRSGLCLAVGCGVMMGCGAAPVSPASSPSFVAAEWEAYPPEYQIRLTTFSGECALRQSSSNEANSSTLDISLELSAGQTTIPPGTYTVGSALVAGGAYAALNVRDANCDKMGPDSTGGAVTLTSALGVVGSQTSGSYSIELADGSTKAGTFSAAFCDTSTVTATNSCVTP
jgi:hypothetical protein